MNTTMNTTTTKLTISERNDVTIRAYQRTTLVGTLRARLYMARGRKYINAGDIKYTGRLGAVAECMELLEAYTAGDEIHVM